MHINLKISWYADQQKIEPALFGLLKNIERFGSLKRASAETGLSYRYAWGLLKKWEGRINAPLVKLERGRSGGAYLTALSEKLLSLNQYCANRLDLEKLSHKLNHELAQIIPSAVDGKYQLYASSDMAISHFHTLLQSEGKLDIELHTKGSLESLKLLHQGKCHIAGFHLPTEKIEKSITPQYHRWLHNDQFDIVKVANRQQGLITLKSNPKKISDLSSLVKRSVKFINRQPDSGTRIIFDELLIHENINKNDINGYRNDEFTHFAVAAMVASRVTDAGFGIQAAADKFDLNFIPVINEIYLLALPKSLNEECHTAIRELLSSNQFQDAVNRFPGYDANVSGTILNDASLLFA